MAKNKTVAVNFCPGFKAVAEAILAAAVLILLFPGPSFSLDLDCLSDAKGEVVTWKSSWQTDNRDDGASYEIADARINGLPEPTEITLLFYANGAAEETRRVMTVKKQAMITELCRSILNLPSRSTGRDPFSREELKASPAPSGVRAGVRPPIQGTDSSRLFITFIPEKGWVRGERPSLGAFVQCEIGGRNFVCLEDEKSRYGDQLADIETDMRIYEQ